MSEPHEPRGRRAHLDELLVQRVLFRTAWRFAWRALARYRFTDADRSDVAQEAVIAAWRARARYRSERGNPEQWLSRIVRNAAIDLLNERRRGGAVVGVDVLADVPSGDLPVEERMSLRDIADLVFAVLPEHERRAVIAIAIEGLTLRDAAALEGVSASTVHDRYERGVTALRDAVERGEDRKLFSIPLPIAASGMPEPASDSDPPPELLERAWQRAIVELGLDRAPDSAARASDAPAPPSSRPEAPAARLLRLLGPLGGVLVGGVITAVSMRGFSANRAQEEPPRALLAPTSAVVRTARADREARLESSATASIPSVEEAPAAGTSARPPAPKYRDPRDPERALVDRGRAALMAGDVAVALALLVQHARRFPHGENAALRDLLMDEACAHARDAHAPSHAGCAGRP